MIEAIARSPRDCALNLVGETSDAVPRSDKVPPEHAGLTPAALCVAFDVEVE